MNNIEKLNQDLEAQRAAQAEADASVGFEPSTELTDEEKATLDHLAEKENSMMVEETGENGMAVKTPLADFIANVDARQTEIKNEIDGRMESLKLVNNAELGLAEAKEKVQKQALAAFQALMKPDQNVDISTVDVAGINDRAIAKLQEYFKVDRIESDTLIRKMSRMTLTQIAQILPEDFMELYADANEIRFNNLPARERVLATINYLCVTGPEMEYLNEYVENENALIMVSKEIMAAQMDIPEMLKSPEKMSELLERSAAIAPQPDDVWAKYIKRPNHIHNTFAQRVVIYQEYLKAYEKLLEEHKDDTNPAARDMIKDEIRECEAKIDIYSNVTDMTLLKDLFNILQERLISNKKTSFKSLEREAIAAVDRIRRCKVNLPFPGYDGKYTRPEDIYRKYIKDYPAMIDNYNAGILKVANTPEQADAEANGVVPIMLDGYPTWIVARNFSLILLLLMGRVVKALSGNNATQHDAIMLDAYFQMFCELGLDIYMIRDVWNTLKDFTKYTIEHWPA